MSRCPWEGSMKGARDTGSPQGERSDVNETGRGRLARKGLDSHGGER